MPIPISMFRDNLETIPQYKLLDGYLMRPYQTGDIEHWLAFHVPLFPEGHITESLFRDDFGRDEAIIAERQFYMIHNNIVMGSISAWYGSEERGQDLGRIHWVVLHEDYRGKGLSKPLLSFALNKLKSLGHQQAYLTTDTDLIPAIGLYLQFGFEPEVHTEQDKSAWDGVFQRLKQ